MLASAISQASFALLVGVTALALATPERWVRLAALLHAMNWVLVAIFQDHGHPPFQRVNFVIDVGGALIALLFAVRSARVWLALFAACQWLGVLTRLAPIVDPTIRHRATVTALYLWDTLSLGVLTGAALRELFQRFPGRRLGSGSRPTAS